MYARWRATSNCKSYVLIHMAFEISLCSDTTPFLLMSVLVISFYQWERDRMYKMSANMCCSSGTINRQHYWIYCLMGQLISLFWSASFRDIGKSAFTFSWNRLVFYYLSFDFFKSFVVLAHVLPHTLKQHIQQERAKITLVVHWVPVRCALEPASLFSWHVFWD